MLCVKMYAVCRSQMFVNMRCRIHSHYSFSDPDLESAQLSKECTSESPFRFMKR